MADATPQDLAEAIWALQVQGKFMPQGQPEAQWEKNPDLFKGEARAVQRPAAATQPASEAIAQHLMGMPGAAYAGGQLAGNLGFQLSDPDRALIGGATVGAIPGIALAAKRGNWNPAVAAGAMGGTVGGLQGYGYGLEEGVMGGLGVAGVTGLGAHVGKWRYAKQKTIDDEATQARQANAAREQAYAQRQREQLEAKQAARNQALEVPALPYRGDTRSVQAQIAKENMAKVLAEAEAAAAQKAQFRQSVAAKDDLPNRSPQAIDPDLPEGRPASQIRQEMQQDDTIDRLMSGSLRTHVNETGGVQGYEKYMANEVFPQWTGLTGGTIDDALEAAARKGYALEPFNASVLQNPQGARFQPMTDLEKAFRDAMHARRGRSVN